MYIVLAVCLFILGFAIAAAVYCMRERNYMVHERNEAKRIADQKSKELQLMQQNVFYYQNEGRYWKGIAFGDKAQTVYAAVVRSVEDGKGFTLQTTPSNVVQFPNGNKAN